MYNSDRIDIFLEKFSDLWHKYPDLRFGQLFYIIKGIELDGFYAEDSDMFIKILDRLDQTDKWFEIDNNRKDFHKLFIY